MLNWELRINPNAIGPNDLVSRIEADLRSGVLARAARDAGRLVEADARPRITAPGYKGDKAGLKPLQQSLTTIVREYSGITIAYVGTLWPEGAHGHLVEFGHVLIVHGVTVGHVPPHPWLRPAAESTLQAQRDTVLDVLRKAAPKE